MEVVSQTFKGIIPPVRIDHVNGDGRIVPIIDWSAIATRYTPSGAVNIQFEFTLEYLTATHYLPTLLKIPGSSYPEFKASDKALQRGVKMVEFKRQFSPEFNYAAQFLLWNWWDGGWREAYFDRDYLFNAGIEGRVNFIKPYLVSVGDTIFGDTKHKLGLSIAPRYLLEGDSIEISGGYSGSISYIWDEPEISLSLGQNGGVDITTESFRVLNSNSKRASLYCSNEGLNRVYWQFGTSTLTPETSPFLDPGQYLTIEHGKLTTNGGDTHKFLGKFANSIIKFSLNAVCKTGSSKLVYQELSYP